MSFDDKVRPHPKRLIGELLEEGPLSSTLWTPNNERRQGEFMRVLAVGDRARDFLPGVNVGDVVMLNYERYGGTMVLEDLETHEKQHYHIVDADAVLAVYTGEIG